MVSLTCNLMIRRGMSPLKEGVRLYFMNYLPFGIFSALAASSNHAINPDSEKRRFLVAPLFTAG